MSDRVTLRLRKLKNPVDYFRLSEGLNKSEAIRFIIEDYFKIQRNKSIETHSKSSELDQLKEELKQIKSDMKELIFTTDTILKMLVVIGYNDEDLRDEFVKYFPKYFKITKV